ncbi:putative T7SS-secreted protein [Amycolatopsis sp. CA-230715]|uniref:putative T7SS-secreted protein n=1 Tax=Amycolatopsis sp. CA-230715 TaxID=2745196 RepID=UPI001C32E941|nr:hypothetical protein [Amycolatopsis sp. CA-230715]QWF81704.1 hypothetical protein HUW46_05137 [Amycolatopsis sp. CA-230715]
MSTMPLETGFPALGFDPAPGKLGPIGDLTEKYQKVGSDLADAKQALENIVNKQGEIWQGQASDAFARRVGKLPEYLGDAADSMLKAAKALQNWNDDLTELQRQARELEVRAQKAAQEARQAQQNPDLRLADQTFPDQASLNAAQQLLTNAHNQLTASMGACVSIQDEAKRLLEQHDRVADGIAVMLDKARELAPDEPSLLGKMIDGALGALGDLANGIGDIADQIGNFIADHANVIAKISDVLGDIGNALGFIGGFLPPPVGEVFGAVGTGLGLTATLGHAVAGAAGADVKPETYVFDALGTAMSAVGALAPPEADLAVKFGGFALLGEQLGGDAGARSIGRAFDGPIGDFENYWKPQNETQAAIEAAAATTGFALPGTATAIALWNAVDQGQDADNAPERVRERDEHEVWDQ